MGDKAAMAALYALWVILAALVLFLLPGMMLTRLVARGKFERSFFAVSFGIGMTVVPYVTFLIVGLLGLRFRVHVSLALTAAVSAAITVGAASAVRYLEGSFSYLRDLLVAGPGRAFSWPLFVYLAFVAAAYLLSYDSALFDQERCVIRAGMLPYFDYLSQNPPVGFHGCLRCFTDHNAFLLWNGGQRMGPSVFVTGFAAVFGFPGFRILHAAFGLLTGWFGFHLGRRLFNDDRAAYLASALLALTPYALSIPLLDENIMALALGTALLFFLFEAPTEWAFAGVFLGLFLGIRHVGVLSLPAVLVAACRSSGIRHYENGWVARTFGRGRPASVIVLTLSTVAFCIPWIVIHSTHIRGALQDGAIGVRDLYESFASHPPSHHSFLGISFEFRGLLSWPFTDVPVRSPYNGYPTLVSIPLTIIRSWGGLLLAFVPLGIVWARRRIPGLAAAGILWTLVQLAMLGTMANWVQPNKMGVFLSFCQPIGLAIAAGIVALAEAIRSRRCAAATVSLGASLVTTLVTLGVLTAFPLLVSSYEAPVDERNYHARAEYIVEDYPSTPPMLRDPEGAYAALDRQRLAGVSALPDFTMARHLLRPGLTAVRLRQLLYDFARPMFKDYCERPKDIVHGLSSFLDPTGRPDTVTFDDMMHHPISRLRDSMGGEWGRCVRSAGPATGRVTVKLDVTLPKAAEQPIVTLAVPEEGRPVHNIDHLVLMSSGNAAPDADGKPCHWVVVPVSPRHYWVTVWYGDFRFDHLDGRGDIRQLEPEKDGAVYLDFPIGSVISLHDVTSIEPTRFHTWTVQVTEDGLDSFGPIPSSY